MAQEWVVSVTIITGVVGGIEAELQFCLVLENSEAIEKVQPAGENRHLDNLFVGILQIEIRLHPESFQIERSVKMHLKYIGVIV